MDGRNGAGDLRLIASMSNVIRFPFFSDEGERTAADLKGGTIGTRLGLYGFY